MGQEEGAGPGQEARAAALLLGGQVGAQGSPAPRLRHSTGLSPQTLDFPRLEDHRRKLSESSPSLHPARNGTVIPPGLRDSPAPRRLVTPPGPPSVPGGCCPLQASCGPGPISQHTQSAGPRNPSRSAPPLCTHPRPREIFRLSQGSELNTGPQSTLSGGGFHSRRKAWAWAQHKSLPLSATSQARLEALRRPFLPLTGLTLPPLRMPMHPKRFANPPSQSTLGPLLLGTHSGQGVRTHPQLPFLCSHWPGLDKQVGPAPRPACEA